MAVLVLEAKGKTESTPRSLIVHKSISREYDSPEEIELIEWIEDEIRLIMEHVVQQENKNADRDKEQETNTEN